VFSDQLDEALAETGDQILQLPERGDVNTVCHLEQPAVCGNRVSEVAVVLVCDEQDADGSVRA